MAAERECGDQPLRFYLEAIGCEATTAAAVVAARSAAAAAREDPKRPTPPPEQLHDRNEAAAREAPAGAGKGEPSPQWRELERRVASCRSCALAERRTQTVFGSGDPDAELLLIGEAPGRDEDLQGEPFVGRAGRLLNRMLEAIDLTREAVQVINVVKCRPPNNRDPRPEEIAACRPFIEAQIRLVAPRVILLLGRVAACAMLGEQRPLSVLRHRWHRIEGIPTLVTYHPAFLLRTPARKADGWSDLLQLRARLEAERGTARR
ncbi:MAG: uracil-DNA glycosylase [Zetaproteobacteria bacterium]|nr:MAG: uracil-DNA glycosylase [Zetaproteobacteria bacterium]